jgi:hypothetical protein
MLLPIETVLMVDKYGIKLMKPIYDKRREVTRNIKMFWPTVIEMSELLAEYITYEDNILLNSLKDLYIEWDEDNVKNFNIHFEFEENDFLETLTFVKRFEQKPDAEDGELISEPVAITWKKHKNLTKPRADSDTSFFNWFNYTGSGPGDYKPGSVIALILSDELYPHAIKFYIEAISTDNQIEDEYDISSTDESEANSDGEVEGGVAEDLDQPPSKKAKKN